MRWRVWIEERPGGFLVRSRNAAGKNGPSQLVSTKSIANELRKKWENRMERQSLGLADPSISVKTIYEEYLRELEKSDQHHYRRAMISAIGPYVADRRTVSDLTTESIQKYRSWMIEHVSMPTVRSRLRHVSAWLSWCVAKNYLPESPFRGIPIPDYVPKPKFLTDEEMTALDQAAVGDIKLMWRIAYTTGIRQANVLEMRGDQIENGMFMIQRTKGKRPISAPIHPLVAELLPKKLPTGRLFEDWNKWKLHWAWGLMKIAARVRRGITWHMARHTFVKKALQSGLTTFEVMKFTGHVSPVSMAPYAHFEMGRLKERHRLIKFPSGRSGQTSGRGVGK